MIYEYKNYLYATLVKQEVGVNPPVPQSHIKEYQSKDKTNTDSGIKSIDSTQHPLLGQKLRSGPGLNFLSLQY